MKKSTVAVAAIIISLFFSACGQEDSTALFTVGGVVSGLSGTVVLQNKGADDIAIATNGPFTFPTGTTSGRTYDIAVTDNPSGQTCLVSNGTGTVLLMNVANVTVNCYDRGALDGTFGSPNGFVIQNNAAGGNGDDFGNAVAIDSQGRIVSVGTSTNSSGNLDMVVWRFNPDGTLDTDFKGGIIVSDSSAGGNGNDVGNGVTIDTRDRVLITGSSQTTGGNTNLVVWRFNPDGTLDQAFGGNGSGIVLHDGGGAGDVTGNAIAIDYLQGKVLVTGSTTTTGGDTDLVVWRFTSTGAIDPGFSKKGFVMLNSVAGGNVNDSGKAIAVDFQGRPIVAGASRNAAGNMDMIVTRFTTTGALDTSFSGDGIVVHDSAAGGSGDDSGNAIAIDSFGRVVVAGSSTNIFGDTDIAVWRFTSTGAPDTTFNNPIGFITIHSAAGGNGNDAGTGIAIDSEGRIIVTGSSTNSSGNSDMVVLRFNSLGAPDLSFGENGIMKHNNAAGGNGNDSGSGIAVDSQDRIVVSGNSYNGSDNDMVIWRVFP